MFLNAFELMVCGNVGFKLPPELVHAVEFGHALNLAARGEQCVSKAASWPWAPAGVVWQEALLQLTAKWPVRDRTGRRRRRRNFLENIHGAERGPRGKKAVAGARIEGSEEDGVGVFACNRHPDLPLTAAVTRPGTAVPAATGGAWLGVPGQIASTARDGHPLDPAHQRPLFFVPGGGPSRNKSSAAVCRPSRFASFCAASVLAKKDRVPGWRPFRWSAKASTVQTLVR